jgi:hypothetical protein
MKTKTFLWLLLLLVVAWSCKQEEEFPPRSHTASVASSTTNLLPALFNLVPDGVYFIQPMAHPPANLALDVPNDSTADQVIIQQFGFHGRLNQQWRVTHLGDGYYSIVNVHSGKALDVPGGSGVVGEKIQQYTYHGGPNQQWRISSSISPGTCWITNRQTGLRLDIPFGSETPGVQLQQYNPHDRANQTWRFRPLPTFWTSALECERSFALTASQIQLDETRALKEVNPVRQMFLLQQIDQRKNVAIKALYLCLSNCVATYGPPPIMCVPPCEKLSSPPFIYCPSREPFSLQRYHQLLVDCYLG